jgi:hypothetical protein
MVRIYLDLDASKNAGLHRIGLGSLNSVKYFLFVAAHVMKEDYHVYDCVIMGNCCHSSADSAT